MKNKIVFIILGFVICLNLEAETFISLANAKEKIEKSIQLFSDKKFQEGLNILKPYWPVSPITLDNLAVETSKKWSIIEENYGKKIDIIFIDAEVIREVIAKYIYIVRFERHILRFEILLYKNNEGWIVSGMNFDDKIDKLFR